MTRDIQDGKPSDVSDGISVSINNTHEPQTDMNRLFVEHHRHRHHDDLSPEEIKRRRTEKRKHRLWRLVFLVGMPLLPYGLSAVFMLLYTRWGYLKTGGILPRVAVVIAFMLIYCTLLYASAYRLRLSVRKHKSLNPYIYSLTASLAVPALIICLLLPLRKFMWLISVQTGVTALLVGRNLKMNIINILLFSVCAGLVVRDERKISGRLQRKGGK